MLNTLDNYINTPLTTRRVQVFDSRLVSIHNKLGHNILPIPKEYNLMDALCYVFDDDPEAIASVLQSWENKVEYALSLMSAISEGIKNKNLCLRCVKNGVHEFIPAMNND